MKYVRIVFGTIIIGMLITAAWQYPKGTASERTIDSFGYTVLFPTPTLNPEDTYDPEPLRVGTQGAGIYHRPWCPYAKRAIEQHGLGKRINYWSREQVSGSHREPDNYCLAGVFDCSLMDEIDFANSGNDPWCGANIRREYGLTGLDERLAGKTLCSMQGYVGIFVDDPADCIDGRIVGSSSECDAPVCQTCKNACGDDPDCICESCVGCKEITMAALNHITLKMGDANRDGSEDFEDYLYFHECFNGINPATTPCRNVFDWDNDGDVDTDDFGQYVNSLKTGNPQWAAQEFPLATVNPPPLELPLRVGTDGASLYHRLDCPSVNSSWETHGLHKRIDFFTWDQIEQSNRVPDLKVCLPGTRGNPSGSLQDCGLDDDSDGLFNCADPCPNDPNVTCS